MNAFSNFLLLVPLTLWAGGFTMLMVFVAPILFGHLPSRNRSGNLMDLMFHRVEILKTINLLGVATSGCIKYLFHAPPVHGKEILISCLLASYLFTIFIIENAIQKKIQGLRTLIVSFDELPKEDPLRKQFGYWHGMMMSCTTVSVFLAFSVLLLRFVL